jgi:hypothetical protein
MAIVNGYATLADVRAALRMTSTVDDPRIEQCVEAASRAIDEVTGRRFFLDVAGTARQYLPSSSTLCIIDDLAYATSGISVQSDDGSNTFATTWLVGSDFQYEPRTAPAATENRPITAIRATGTKRFLVADDLQRSVQVSGKWGWASIPHAIRNATIQQAINLFKRHDSPGGVVSSDFGSFRVPRVDPDVAMLVRPFKRTVIG